MREIDYSVPDSEKDVTPQFKVGDYVEGDCLYLERGQIESIEMSTGARKGLIYKIGLSYFFYNFIKPWYDGMVMEKFGSRKIRLVRGSYENIKITTQDDLVYGEAILRARMRDQAGIFMSVD